VCVDERLKEIIRQIAQEFQATVIELEITPALPGTARQGRCACGASVPDHVHLLCEVDPQFGIQRLVRYLKGRSSHLLRQEFSWLCSRLPTRWSNSYFVATVGGAPLADIKRYIEDQKIV
jgi:putative transposase